MNTASRTPEGHAPESRTPEDWNATTPLPGAEPTAGLGFGQGAAGSREARARTFVAAVRSQLADLGPEEVDELTDGLAADLTDRLGEDPALGDPVKYAAELRQAAGLPQRASRSDARHSVAESWAALVRGWHAWWAGTPARVAVRDFALALRPLWWVARGGALAAVLCMLVGIPSLAVWALVSVATVIVSVQWGRGRWAPDGWGVWLRRVASAVSVLAIVLLSPAALGLLRGSTTPYVEEPDMQTSWGLTSNGTEISNIFAYDCAGQPLDGVQLFAQDGTPLHTGAGDPRDADWLPASGADPETGELLDYRRNAVATMPDEWNVFPLREARVLDGVYPDPDATGEASVLPYERVPSLGNCDALAGSAADTETKEPKANDAETQGADAKSADAKGAEATPNSEG
ncbi:hypothetical protein [Leucobacter chromiireducens]|uniref:Uncharacterized protein n=1 Tax=Leucobacter chromiireducens subsp. chromiireducens TaxID=660067 RepID=A0ABS1SQC8_9MICO|nr:hypothetical protein [Leucobacter chromiireducens]MBL3690293.1 hypothetical protein [Leucobacter chromiireducens subsp. chromiireducens]